MIMVKLTRVTILIFSCSFILVNDSILNKFNTPIFNVDDNIRPDTMGIDILIKVLKNLVFLTLFIKIDIISIIINDGKITPKVAIMAPSIP